MCACGPALAAGERAVAAFGVNGTLELHDPYGSSAVAVARPQGALYVVDGERGVRRVTPDGQFDPTFGVGGVIPDSKGAQIASMTDGRLYLVDRSGDFELRVRRYRADGTLDTSYASIGERRIVDQCAINRVGSDFGEPLVVHKSGAVDVLVSTEYKSGERYAYYFYAKRILRLDADGAVKGRITMVPPAEPCGGTGQLGMVGGDGGTVLVISQSDGLTSHAVDGVVRWRVPHGDSTYERFSNFRGVESDGTIRVVRYRGTATSAQVERYSTDGTRLADVDVASGTFDPVTGTTLHSGHAWGGMVLSRSSFDGTPDDTFGVNGRLVVCPTTQNFPMPDSAGTPRSMVIDGGIITVRTSLSSIGTSGPAVLVRVAPDGRASEPPGVFLWRMLPYQDTLRYPINEVAYIGRGVRLRIATRDCNGPGTVSTHATWQGQTFEGGTLESAGVLRQGRGTMELEARARDGLVGRSSMSVVVDYIAPVVSVRRNRMGDLYLVGTDRPAGVAAPIRLIPPRRRECFQHRYTMWDRAGNASYVLVRARSGQARIERRGAVTLRAAANGWTRCRALISPTR